MSRILAIPCPAMHNTAAYDDDEYSESELEVDSIYVLLGAVQRRRSRQSQPFRDLEARALHKM
jgi:hypothetical protein